jgi:hypothetical protein
MSSLIGSNIYHAFRISLPRSPKSYCERSLSPASLDCVKLLIIVSYAVTVQKFRGPSFPQCISLSTLGGGSRRLSPAETSETPVVPRTVSISNSMLSHQLNLYENSDLQNQITLEEWLAGLCIHLNYPNHQTSQMR